MAAVIVDLGTEVCGMLRPLPCRGGVTPDGVQRARVGLSDDGCVPLSVACPGSGSSTQQARSCSLAPVMMLSKLLIGGLCSSGGT